MELKFSRKQILWIALLFVIVSILSGVISTFIYESFKPYSPFQITIILFTVIAIAYIAYKRQFNVDTLRQTESSNIQFEINKHRRSLHRIDQDINSGFSITIDIIREWQEHQEYIALLKEENINNGFLSIEDKDIDFKSPPKLNNVQKIKSFLKQFPILIIVGLASLTITNSFSPKLADAVSSYLFPTPTPTITVTPTPTLTPTPTPTPCAFDDCLSYDPWFVYPRANYQPSDNNCLPIPQDWGLEIGCNEIEIFYNDYDLEPSRNSFYLMLDDNQKISFDIKIEILDGNDGLGYIGFGVSSINPETPLFDKPESGLYLQRETSDNYSSIYYKNKWKSVNQRYESYIFTNDGSLKQYSENTTIHVSFSIDRNELNIFQDNFLLIGPIPIPAHDRAFWIEYYFEQTGILKATISNFSINYIE